MPQRSVITTATLQQKVAQGDDCPGKEFYTLFRNDVYIAYEDKDIVGASVVNVPIEMALHRQLECNAGNSSKDTDNRKESLLQEVRETAALLESKVVNLKDEDWLEIGKSFSIFKRLQNCSNASQLTTFFSTVGGGIPRLKRSGAMIGVQPTSKARRAANRSKGNRTLSYGRNAKVIQLLKIARKQKATHNIGQNIKSYSYCGHVKQAFVWQNNTTVVDVSTNHQSNCDILYNWWL